MTAKPKSLTITLSLSPDLLINFPHEPVPAPAPASKLASPPSDTPAPQIHIEPTSANTPADATNNMNDAGTPSSLAPPAAAPKKKGPKPGSKRNAAAMDGTDSVTGATGATGAVTPKQRGKPGPKRKKMGDMLNDPNEKGPFATAAPMAKLGPKANMGIINQNLRALDRTGKFKCRKWQKRGFRIRSFTGVVWEVPSYKAHARDGAFADDVKSESTVSSESKMKDESSAISEKSGLNGDSTPVPTPLNGLASSPAPIPAA